MSCDRICSRKNYQRKKLGTYAQKYQSRNIIYLIRSEERNDLKCSSRFVYSLSFNIDIQQLFSMNLLIH
uniref:Uncharacterized protein n=1 Tax=Lepeophtheirus salmonis TaxID=72036 RepID=A0A0K2V4T7_LEPSM